MNSPAPILAESHLSSEAPRRWLPLILGIAVGLRLALGILHPFSFPDSKDYESLAHAILEHRPYEVGGKIAWRMPGYPLFMAVIYAFTAGSTAVLLAIQALIGGAIVFLIYRLARRINETAGLFAAALAALDPLSIGFSAAVLSETPFTLCLVLAIWLCIRLIENQTAGSIRTWSRWIILGILWAIAVYLRGAALWCIVPLVLWVAFLRKGPLALRLAGALTTIIIMFALLMPWLARNYSHFHSGPLRLTTLEGISLYESVYPEADGGPKQDKIPEPPEFASLSECQKSDEWSRRAWDHIRSDPMRITSLGLKKIARTWSPLLNADDFRSLPIQGIMLLWHIPLYLLGLLGLFSLAMPLRMKILVLIPVIYFTLLHALFLGSVRYRVPLMPLVCIFAGLGAWTVARQLRGKAQSRQPSLNNGV